MPKLLYSWSESYVFFLFSILLSFYELYLLVQVFLTDWFHSQKN